MTPSHSDTIWELEIFALENKMFLLHSRFPQITSNYLHMLCLMKSCWDLKPAYFVLYKWLSGKCAFWNISVLIDHGDESLLRVAMYWYLDSYNSVLLHFIAYHVMLTKMSLRIMNCWRHQVTKSPLPCSSLCVNVSFKNKNKNVIHSVCSATLDTTGHVPLHWSFKKRCIPSCEYLGTCRLVSTAYLHLSVLCGGLLLPGRLIVDIMSGQ